MGFRQFRIPVVDDDCDVADSLATLLDVLVTTCAFAYRGSDVIDVADQYRTAFVALDLYMQDWTGWKHRCGCAKIAG